MKMTTIEEDKIEQFLYENLSWERLLDFFKQENSYLKTRLSKVLDGNTDKGFLVLAEHFQNKFIITDDFIDELEHDVNELRKKLKNETASGDEKVVKLQQKLRNEIEYLEKNFTDLKNEFNKYLLKIIAQ
jgi:seryl-tRNA synthetase